MVKSLKFCSESFHHHTDRRVFFGRWEIGEITQCLHDKKFRLALQLSLQCIAPKICQGQSQQHTQECSRFCPIRFTFGTVITKRVKSAVK